jgi:uncharacterized membrane protein YqgA involved in biofilm formation
MENTMTTPVIVALSACALLFSILLGWRMKSAPEHVRMPVMAVFGAVLVAMGVAVLVFGEAVPLVIVAGFALAGRGLGAFAADRSSGAGPSRS